jgi:aminoglycoside phosphotransferase (APT) family kinase protein
VNSGILAALEPVIAGYKARFEGLLEPEYMALAERLAQAMPGFYAEAESPRTVQHGDFRLDNILFAAQGGARRMATLDWQTVTCGPGLLDVTYFLSAGLPVDLRRAHEVELVRLYHAELLRLGVTGYDWDFCWRDYRRFAIHGVFMGVFSAMVVERTDRSDQLFLAMTRGGCAQALDHDAFSFWGA